MKHLGACAPERECWGLHLSRPPTCHRILVNVVNTPVPRFPVRKEESSKDHFKSQFKELNNPMTFKQSSTFFKISRSHTVTLGTGSWIGGRFWASVLVRSRISVSRHQAGLSPYVLSSPFVRVCCVCVLLLTIVEFE